MVGQYILRMCKVKLKKSVYKIVPQVDQIACCSLHMRVLCHI